MLFSGVNKKKKTNEIVKAATAPPTPPLKGYNPALSNFVHMKQYTYSKINCESAHTLA